MQTLSVDQLLGQMLGNYRVERLVGQSRLNAVYLARSRSGQAVALTLYMVPDRFSPDARNRFLGRFEKKAAVLTTLQHPHILPVYDYGEYRGHPYLITPYMMNGSLADTLKREGRLSYERVLTILQQMVEGLAYAHSKGLLHGTLKPSNIVVSPEQTMVVAGVGLMHLLQMHGIEQSDLPYTCVVSIVDTYLVSPAYVAPEIAHGQRIDTRSDIYALGVILFELLSGRIPFTGTNPLEVDRMHVEQGVPSLRAICPGVPLALASVVNQALERDPVRRFQHIHELVEAFAQVTRGATNVFLQKSQSESLSSSRRQDLLQEISPDDYATTSWQLTPPIITDKLASMPPPNQETTSGFAASSGLATPDARSLRLRVTTGRIPVPKASTRPPQEPISEEIPLHPPEYAQEDTLMPQMSARPVPEQPMEMPSSSLPPAVKPVSPSAARARNVKRRQALAVLAGGAVVGVGMAFAANTPLLHRVLSRVTTAGNPTQSMQKGKTAPTSTMNGKMQMGAGSNMKTVIGSSTLPPNSSQVFVNPIDQKASLLIHLPDGKFVAYERACTHVGVYVNFDPATRLLVCPAHGAIFDPARGAAVVQGPATRPLPKVAIQVNGDGTITTI